MRTANETVPSAVGICGECGALELLGDAALCGPCALWLERSSALARAERMQTDARRRRREAWEARQAARFWEAVGAVLALVILWLMVGCVLELGWAAGRQLLAWAVGA